MFLDASAIIAIITGEPDAASLQTRLGKADTVHVSPIVIYEAVLGLARIGRLSISEASGLLDQFLAQLRANVLAIDSATGRGALDACERFGKGRHPARLNMGDCFAYACARAVDAPLLCKGDDFTRTDIARA
ncbi:MAG TPA: type II toxin-antitoxin system VapC family toxin [Acetobacteraceae bacterium]|nr:type II toxin-antitoxin system VapC family toxin [Acetobacteraceae bacterium]